MGKFNWRKFGMEFLSIFIAVISAFALNNWNDNRRDHLAKDKILAEMYNGLTKDIDDIRVNVQGHEQGISACKFWRDIINNRDRNQDSLQQYFFDLTRDFISIQNVSGYETLKSRGLELIEDDSLRWSIISLYEYDYNVLMKFEETYHEMQYHENYFEKLNVILAPHFSFDEKGNINGIEQPLNITKADRNVLMNYLWKIQVNRMFILFFYDSIGQKLERLKKSISEVL